MHLAQPDWLYHHLYASGPAEALTAFEHAVRGPGYLPWDIHYDQLEDDWFYRLIENQRAHAWRTKLAFPAARRIARQVREATWLMHEALPPPDRAFDLNAIVPVPSQVLGLGVTHPDSATWLWQHWGTTWPLRHVRRFVPTGSSRDNAALQQRRAHDALDRTGARTCRRGEPGVCPRDHTWAVEFFSADWTPWAAIGALRARFPEVSIEVSVRYGDAT